MKVLVLAWLVFSLTSLGFAGPFITFSFDTTFPNDLDRWTFGIDPNGETGYTSVDVTVAATSASFSNPTNLPLFSLPSEDTGVIGVGGGYTFLDTNVTGNAMQFTFSSLGGVLVPPTSSFADDFFQVTGPVRVQGLVTYRFADANGIELTEFERRLGFGRNTPRNLQGSPSPSENNGVISLQPAFDDGSGLLDDALHLYNYCEIFGSGPFYDLGEITITVSNDPFGLFAADLDDDNVDLLLDVNAARRLPPGTMATADLLIVSQFFTSLNYTLTAVVPEPSTLLLAILALGVVGGWRKWGG